MLCNVPEEWRSSPYRDGSLKSHIAAEFNVQKLDKKQRIILTQSVPKCIQSHSSLIFSIFHTGNYFTVLVCYIIWVITFYYSHWQSYRSDVNVIHTERHDLVLWMRFALGSIPLCCQLTYTYESSIHITLKLIATKLARHVSNSQVQIVMAVEDIDEIYL